MGDPMAWWFWFGGWIAIIASLFLTWWLFLEAMRKKGGLGIFALPLVAVVGIALQIPAVMMGGNMGGASDAAAFVGILGVVVCGIATVTFFSTKAPSSGSSWSAGTKDVSGNSATRERRRSKATAGVGVPLPTEARAAHVQNQGGALPHAGPEVSVDQAPVEIQTVRSDRTVSAAQLAASMSRDNLDDAETLSDDETVSFCDEDQTIAEESTPIALERTQTFERAATLLDEPQGPRKPSSDGPRLVVQGGQSSQIIISERSGPYIVGRDPSQCSLAVDDLRVSRKHFSIDRVGGDYVIRDLESGNGTFLNGQPLLETETLKDGDEIEFGRTSATFVSGAVEANG